MGVLVLEAIDTKQFTVMSHVWYALNRTKIKGGELLSSLMEVVANHKTLEQDIDGGVGVQKIAYHNTKRCPRTSNTSHKIPSKLSLDVVKEVITLTCCGHHYCQIYPWDKTKWLMTKYWSISFKAKCKYAYAIIDQLHQKEGEVRLYITTGGVEVCKNAWWKIHGISKSTHMVYKQCLEVGHVSFMRENIGVKHP